MVLLIYIRPLQTSGFGFARTGKAEEPQVVRKFLSVCQFLSALARLGHATVAKKWQLAKGQHLVNLIAHHQLTLVRFGFERPQILSRQLRQQSLVNRPLMTLRKIVTSRLTVRADLFSAWRLAVKLSM